MHKDELATDRLSRSLVEGLGKREPNPPPAFPAREEGVMEKVSEDEGERAIPGREQKHGHR
jgi:hypothetical protein